MAAQVLEQPSLLLMLPSSQASWASLILLPHFSQAWPGVAQLYGAPSALQLLEQPSPLVLLPSSHCSPESSSPLPKRVQTPALVHVQPVSICLQSLRQPSPLAALPSSQ